MMNTSVCFEEAAATQKAAMKPFPDTIAIMAGGNEVCVSQETLSVPERRA